MKINNGSTSYNVFHAIDSLLMSFFYFGFFFTQTSVVVIGSS